MGEWLDYRYGNRQETELRRLPLELKRCPLCGTINAVSNGECVTCSWAGSFEQDPEIIEEGLYEMMVRCPELAEALLDVPDTKKPRFSLLGWVKGLFRRKVDFQA
jgi:hypothetical protein